MCSDRSVSEPLLGMLLVLSCLFGSCKGGGDDGPAPPPRPSQVRYEEAAGPDTNVIRFSDPDLDRTTGVVSLELSASGLTDRDLFGLSFDLEIDEAIGAEYVTFTASAEPGILAHASQKQGKSGRVVLGVASRATTKLLPADFVIGTMKLRSDRIGQVGLQILPGAPGARLPSGGVAFVKAGDLLNRVQGPAVRGGTLVLE